MISVSWSLYRPNLKLSWLVHQRVITAVHKHDETMRTIQVLTGPRGIRGEKGEQGIQGPIGIPEVLDGGNF